MNYNALAGTHDLSLPEWGPYGKRFFGISHIADHRRGTRFDFTVIPAIYRRQLAVPDALRPAGYLPWSVSPDLKNYCYRQQLEWKDRIYCDVSFAEIDAHSRLVACECVNHSELDTDFALHFLSSLVPNGKPLNCNAPYAKPHLLSGNGLVFDCLKPGEVRMDGVVDGSAYRLKPGEKAEISLPAHGTLWLRAAVEGKALLRTSLGTFELCGDGAFQTYRLREDFSGGKFFAETDSELKIDVFSVADQEPEFFGDTLSPRPEFSEGALPDSRIIRYPGLPHAYGVRWDFPDAFTRRYAVDDFNSILLYKDGVHMPHLGTWGDRGGKDCHLDIFLQPVRVEAGASRTVYAIVADGSETELAERLAFPFERAPEHCRAARNSYLRIPESPMSFSQERMSSVVLTNVVYPTYVEGRFVRHHTPGRCWNSLYTWDSGFIGLGLMEIDMLRAVENLNAYTTDPGNPDNAFVLHGTPVPVQIYLFFELWNRTCDRALLEYFYPRLKQYYDYLAGHAPRSTTRRGSREPMIRTWDYFYNTGGWDDYPPQHAAHPGHLSVIPCVGTSHVIRCAKMLRMLAAELGTDDAGYYDADIRDLSVSLQQYAWDAESGYFGYVDHDEAGNPTGIYRHGSGVNFNMGLDGVMPLEAGAVTPEQAELLWERLSSPEHCWSDAGLSTVDRSAPYYRTDGYWNGCVWMPYQWFFWKTALNDGRSGFAWRIAETALRLWEREVRASYACCEHFSISSGRGCGWHHFSALSAPVLNFHAAYYSPGTLTSGYDVLRRSFACGAGSGMTAELVIGGEAGMKTTLVAVLPREPVSAEYAGKPVPVRKRTQHAFELDLPKASSGILRIR